MFIAILLNYSSSLSMFLSVFSLALAKRWGNITEIKYIGFSDGFFHKRKSIDINY